MLQKGLSNRPSGAVALLLLAGSLALNWVRGENILAERFWGVPALNWGSFSCYAEQAACHLNKVLEEVVTGSSYDFGYEKRSRKVVEINQPDVPFNLKAKPRLPFQGVSSPRCTPAPTAQTVCPAPA